MGPEDPNHDAAVSKIRSVTKDWVAAYRKGGNYQGRPSYGCAAWSVQPFCAAVIGITDHRYLAWPSAASESSSPPPSKLAYSLAERELSASAEASGLKPHLLS